MMNSSNPLYYSSGHSNFYEYGSIDDKNYLTGLLNDSDLGASAGLNLTTTPPAYNIDMCLNQPVADSAAEAISTTSTTAEKAIKQEILKYLKNDYVHILPGAQCWTTSHTFACETPDDVKPKYSRVFQQPRGKRRRTNSAWSNASSSTSRIYQWGECMNQQSIEGTQTSTK